MNWISRCICVLSLMGILTVSGIWAEMPGAPEGRVSDFAGILADGTKNQITGILESLEKTNGAEVAVVTIQSLEGISVEEYAVKLFNHWGIGKKDADNGVLFLIAPSERKVRIEVGYGLEPVITDGRAGRILDEYVIPHFKAGNYEKGILQGCLQISALINEGELIPSKPPLRSSDSDLRWKVKLLIILFFSILITFGFIVLGASFSKKGDSSFRIWGVSFGGLSLLLSIAFAFGMNFPAYILPIWAVIMFLTGLYFRNKIMNSLSASVFHSSGEGTSLSNGWGSGGFSGGSSFGGFSGGSSGGGGSSRSW